MFATLIDIVNQIKLKPGLLEIGMEIMKTLFN